MTAYERALMRAKEAHAGQVDKAGQPYMGHVLRVTAMVDGEARVPALLHDVVEDAGVTLDELERDFGPGVAQAVDALTRRETETYFEYIVRVVEHPQAAEVKLADVRDHLAHQTAIKKTLVARYERALEILEEAR